MTEDQETKAYELHEQEAERMKAEFYNCGWGVSAEENWISIASKTSKGILMTNVDFGPAPEPPIVTHEWKW